MRKTAAIILAAGKGTRMKSSKPKVVFKLAEIPMINRVIATAQKAGSDEINVVVGYKKEEVKNIITEKVSYSVQDQQKGTGHAVMVTKDAFKDFEGDIFILCGDVPLLKDSTLTKMLKKHREENSSCTVLTAFMDDALKYGRIVRNAAGNVERIVEFKDATAEQKEINEINTGIYCFDSKDMFNALESIDDNNAQNEYYLTDTLEILNKKGKKVISATLDNMVEASGVNSQKQLSELENLHYSDIRDLHMNNGVKIQNPSSVLIGDDVIIGNDVEISANVIIEESKIDAGAKIGPFSKLFKAEIGKNSQLEGSNCIKNSKIDDEKIIPFGKSVIDE